MGRLTLQQRKKVMAGALAGRHLTRGLVCCRTTGIQKIWPLAMQTKTSPILAVLASTSASVDRKIKPGENFWKKNERMERPMSPHILIYKFQLPALLSGSHRVTGFIYSLLSTGIAGFALFAPEHAPYYLEAIKAWNIPSPILFTGKCLLVWPFFYHTVNGLRHLAWDAAKGFEMKTLYKTGYTVLAISVLCSVATVYYFST